MSVALEYTAKCVECKRVMRPGTLVDFIKDGASYTYVHAVTCEQPDEPKRRPRFELRICTNNDCYGAAGIGFERKAPPVCHWCGSAWEQEPAVVKPIAPAMLNAAVSQIARAA